jgi:hypothetical protein
MRSSTRKASCGNASSAISGATPPGVTLQVGGLKRYIGELEGDCVLVFPNAVLPLANAFGGLSSVAQDAVETSSGGLLVEDN